MRILALVWPSLRAPDADARAFPRMLDALDDLSPRIEAVDVGVALVDITGLGPMFGTERRIAARAVALTRAVAPLRVRCGVGGNRWLASLAARLAQFERPDAAAAFATLERDALRDLPLTLLPADAAMRQRFALFGLTTMAQLADLPRSAVGAQFGANGERLQALARGDDPRPLVLRRRPQRVEVSEAFDPPLDGVGSVALTLRRLAAELCDQLHGRHLAPGRASLVLHLEDTPAVRVAQPFPQPVLEPDWIARLLLSRIEGAARGRARTLPQGRASSPDTNQGDLSHHETVSNGTKGSQNRGKYGTQIGSHRPRELESVPKATTVDIWQESPSEPRVTSIRLTFDRLTDPASTQLPALEAQAARWDELRWSLERIRHRFGEGRLWKAVNERPMAALPEHRSRLVDIGP